MDSKKDILNQFKKTEKPSVPTDFFDDFSNGILSKIDNDSFIENIHKTNKPKVPSDFFNDFPEKMVSKVVIPTKKGKIIPFVIGLVAVAAVLLLFFNPFKNTVVNQNIENSIATENRKDTTTKKESTVVNNTTINSSIAEVNVPINSIEIEVSTLNLFSASEQNEEVLLFATLEEELDDFYYDL